MTLAVSQLIDGEYLLDDPSRSFLRLGDLSKKSGRTGRSASYRFFLFSDVLLYASKVDEGKYRIHGDGLSLHLMKVTDWFPPSQKCRQVSFEIHHPLKKFQVICTSSEDRIEWVHDIRTAVTHDMERRMKIEAARLAAYTRG